MTNNPTWRNHYLPQLLSGNWTLDSKLAVYLKEYEKWDKFKPARAVGWLPKLYQSGIPGEEDRYEHMLRDKENKWAEVLSRLALEKENFEISESDSQLMLDLVQYQLFRGPERLEELWFASKEALSSQSISELISSEPHEIDILAKDIALHSLIEKSPLAEALKGSKLNLYYITSDLPLLIADQPVLQFENGELTAPTIFNSQLDCLVLPVSRYSMVLVSLVKGIPVISVDNINTSTIRNADKRILCHPDDQEYFSSKIEKIMPEVKKNLPSLPSKSAPITVYVEVPHHSNPSKTETLSYTCHSPEWRARGIVHLSVEVTSSFLSQGLTNSEVVKELNIYYGVGSKNTLILNAELNAWLDALRDES